MVFDVYCPQHGSTVLLGFRNIESFVNTPEGIRVRFRCDCGYTGTWVTGSHAEMASAAADQSA